MSVFDVNKTVDAAWINASDDDDEQEIELSDDSAPLEMNVTHNSELKEIEFKFELPPNLYDHPDNSTQNSISPKNEVLEFSPSPKSTLFSSNKKFKFGVGFQDSFKFPSNFNSKPFTFPTSSETNTSFSVKALQPLPSSELTSRASEDPSN